MLREGEQREEKDLAGAAVPISLLVMDKGGGDKRLTLKN